MIATQHRNRLRCINANGLPPSVVATAVRRLLGRRLFKAIKEQCVDTRSLLDTAAEIADIPIDEVGQTVAEYLNMPYLRRLAPFDLYNTLENISISTLYERGVTLVVGDNRLKGLACIDPQQGMEVAAQLNTALPLYLAPWGVIRTSLEVTEQQYLSRENQIARSRPQKPDGEILLKHILELATIHSAQQIEMAISSEHQTEIRLYCGARGIGTAFVQPAGTPALIATIEAYMNNSRPLPGGRYQFAHNATSPQSRYLLTASQLTVAVPPGTPEKFELLANDPGKQSHAKTTQSEFATSGTILVVDNNPAFLKILKRYLLRQQLTIISTTTREKALTIASRNSNDLSLIVSDLHMPDKDDGMAFIKELKEIPSLAEIPIIMLTSDDSVDTEVEALRAGANIFCSKKDDPRLLSIYAEKLSTEYVSKRAGD